jgi:hypothetical protein
VLRDDAARAVSIDMAVGRSRTAGNLHGDQRLLLAETDAAGLRDSDVADAAAAQLVEDGRHGLTGARGNAAGTHANDDPGT